MTYKPRESKLSKRMRKAFAKLSNDELIKEHTIALKYLADGNNKVIPLLNMVENELKKRGIVSYKL